MGSDHSLKVAGTVGTLAAAAVAWLVSKIGIEMPADVQAALVGAVGSLVGWLVAYITPAQTNKK